MNHKPRKLDKKLLLVDFAALTVALVLALFLRYHGQIAAWQLQMYSMIYVVMLLITALIHFYRVPRRRNPAIYLLDPFDILVETFHNQIILLAAVAVFLIGTQSAGRASRLAILYCFLLNLAFDYVFRLTYWAWAKEHHSHVQAGRNYLIVTRPEYLERVYVNLKMSLPPEEKIWGVAFLQDDRPFDKTKVIPEELIDCGVFSPVNGWQLRLPSTVPGGLEAFLYLPDQPENSLRRIARQFGKRGINVSVAITAGKSSGGDVMGKRIGHRGNYGIVEFDALQERVPVLGVPYAVTSMDTAIAFVESQSEELSGQYLCFSNVHTTVMARDDAAYAAVLKGAAFVFPDGTPIAKRMKKYNEDADRVPGPDFMEAMFLATMDGSLSHYFYGSTQETLDLLKTNLTRKYPGLRIAGMYSPPFRAMSQEEDEEIVRRINESGADIVWIGLGAPKQEKWMAAHKGRIHGVMAGVGAGFNFHAGNIKRAPYWVQKMGLEWLYRLFQDPKRLFSRYLVTNCKFFWYSLIDRDDRSQQ